MLIRKNTKAFKAIKEIIESCKDRTDRQRLVRMYITKAGHSIKDRISVDSIQDQADLFYEITYDAVFNNLESSGRQLHQSDDEPGIYFFQTASNKIWDETPFEFDEVLKKEFSTLNELPVFRKKEKGAKYILPVSKTKSAPLKREVVAEKKAKPASDVPKQPSYKLKHQIIFTGLDNVVFKNPRVTKRDVLDYYNGMSNYILPYLKDRVITIRSRDKDRVKEFTSIKSLAGSNDIPKWTDTRVSSEEIDSDNSILCNNKESLLWYVEMGAVEFSCSHSRIPSIAYPDYSVVQIDSLKDDKDSVLNVARVTEQILTALRLPSLVKWDGLYGLHVYIPLDAKSEFALSENVAQYICKLIRLKLGDQVVLEGSDEPGYGKISLSYQSNRKGGNLAIPYSLSISDSPTVATPLEWSELNETFAYRALNYKGMVKRLREKGDLLRVLIKNKNNAKTISARLDENYSFLF